MINDRYQGRAGRHQAWRHIIIAYAFFIGLAA